MDPYSLTSPEQEVLTLKAWESFTHLIFLFKIMVDWNNDQEHKLAQLASLGMDNQIYAHGRPLLFPVEPLTHNA